MNSDTKRIEPDDENQDDEYLIDIAKTIRLFWDNKIVIAGLTSIGAVLSVILALQLPIIYTSSALVVDARNNTTSMSQYAGIANLAGISMPSSSSANESQIAMARINTLDFFKEHIYQEVLVELTAVVSWDSSLNKLIFDSKIYDIDNNLWLSEKPSFQQAYDAFHGHFSFVQNPVSGLHTIKVEHFSPYVAKAWADLTISKINLSMRERELEESSSALEYYENKLNKTSSVALTQMFASLIEEKQKSLMLANVVSEYSFMVIEPPVVAEKRSKPARAKFCIIFTLISGLLSLLFVISAEAFRTLAARNAFR